MIETMTLHLVVDPLCGWCFGASSLFEGCLEIEDLKVEVHCGGMWIDENRRLVDAQWKAIATSYDRQIAKVCGQDFGEAYQNGLLNDTTALLDSKPPTVAVLAAQDLGVNGLAMLKAVQKAMFIDGRKIAELDVLSDIAESFGLDRQEFETRFHYFEGEPFRNHVDDSRRFLGQISGRGFPSAALINQNGAIQPIMISQFYGQKDLWMKWLKGEAHK